MKEKRIYQHATKEKQGENTKIEYLQISNRECLHIFFYDSTSDSILDNANVLKDVW